MKRIYICSPYKGKTYNVEKHKQLARVYCRMAWDKGFFPIAPHLYLPQFLDDWSKTERSAALKYGLKALEQCAEIWVFGKKISTGMKAEIEKAEALKIPVKYFTEYGEEEPL